MEKLDRVSREVRKWWILVYESRWLWFQLYGHLCLIFMKTSISNFNETFQLDWWLSNYGGYAANRMLFYFGFGCRGGVSHVQARFLFRFLNRVIFWCFSPITWAFLLFIPDFNKVEVAFYSEFWFEFNFFGAMIKNVIKSNLDFIEIRNKK